MRQGTPISKSVHSVEWFRIFHPRYWNTISHLYSFFTRPYIGSPVEFSGFYGLYLKEYNLLSMPESLRRAYLNFCYPEAMHNRSMEIEYDRRYWPHASTLIVWDQPQRIIGTVQLIRRELTPKLPIEFGVVAQGSPGAGKMFDVGADSGGASSMEIYRLRRTFDIDSHKAPMLVTMMFKAIWAKIIETRTRYLYLSYDSGSAELGNLYQRRLDFKNIGVPLCYGGSGKQWNVLRKDCLLHEREYANMSPKNFLFQTYCRTNLKRKRYSATA
jgi:hypothetical protein